MKTINELEQNILTLLMKMHREYPELPKHLADMPVKDTADHRGDRKSFKDQYHTLQALVNEYAQRDKYEIAGNDSTKDNPVGYPLYPASDDIYNRGKQEINLNPEDMPNRKPRNEKEGQLNEKAFRDDLSGSDLDIPGSELDDPQERVGNEDEENNYYSIGGDNHNDLDEAKD